MLLHNRNKSPSNRHDSTRLSVGSRLAAASPPFSCLSCPGCASSSAAACPSPAWHRWRPHTPARQGARGKAGKPQPGWQQHLARNRGSAPAWGMLHRQGSKAGTTGCMPWHSHRPPAHRLHTGRSCSRELLCHNGLHPAPSTVHSPHLSCSQTTAAKKIHSNQPLHTHTLPS